MNVPIWVNYILIQGRAPSTTLNNFQQSLHHAFLHHRRCSLCSDHLERNSHIQHNISSATRQLCKISLPVRPPIILSQANSSSLTQPSNNAKLLTLFPKDTAQCLAKCQAAASKADGCAEDDFACHCVNYWAYSKVRFPSSLCFIATSF